MGREGPVGVEGSSGRRGVEDLAVGVGSIVAVALRLRMGGAGMMPLELVVGTLELELER